MRPCIQCWYMPEAEVEPHECTGGKATCCEKAYCEICGNAYGEFDPEAHTYLNSWSYYDEYGHSKYCIACGEAYTEMHCFVNGFCVCGAAENMKPAEPVFAEELAMKSVNIDLASAIAINFNGLASIFDQYTDVYAVYNKIDFSNYTGSHDAVTFKVTYTDEKGNAAVKNYTMADLHYDKDSVYELHFAEFYSTQMREIATCEIYIDGVLHASYGNSIENYCYSTLNKASNSDAMKYLATRMSFYGDASYAAYGK